MNSLKTMGINHPTFHFPVYLIILRRIYISKSKVLSGIEIHINFKKPKKTPKENATKRWEGGEGGKNC